MRMHGIAKVDGVRVSRNKGKQHLSGVEFSVQVCRVKGKEGVCFDIKWICDFSHINDGSKPSSDDGKKVDEDPRKDSECNDQEKEDNDMPALEDYSIFYFIRDDEDDGVVADMNNLDTTIQVSPIPTI
ncbi:hypothetical protein Tco_0069259, partial [Tanacetum coccineum]